MVSFLSMLLYLQTQERDSKNPASTIDKELQKQRTVSYSSLKAWLVLHIAIALPQDYYMQHLL